MKKIKTTNKINKLLSSLIVISVFLLILSIISPSKENKEKKETNENINNIVASNNNFSVNICKEISKNSENQNVFLSGYSILVPFGMVYEGSNGQTAKEIQNLFLFPKDDKVRLNGFYQMITSINQNNKTYQLYSANSIWIEKNFEVFPNYLNKIKQYYLSSVEKVGFINSTEREESRKKINNWVENKTNQKIKELLQKSVLNEDTRIVIVNAIYFKSKWQSIFQKELTKEEEFKIDEKNKILVKMMNKTGYFNYFENEKLQCLEIPYKENELSMFILLPKKTLQELEKELDYDYINNTIKKLQTTYVELRLPKFKIEKTYALKEILQNMGLKTAFNEKADFSLISKEKLFISYVIHKTFVEVNEEGTEAAGATAITMSITSIPSEIKIFHANKPFIFFIQHKKTNAILFIGKLYNPLEK